MADFAKVQITPDNAAEYRQLAEQHKPSSSAPQMGTRATDTGMTKSRIVFHGNQAHMEETGLQRSSLHADVPLPSDLAGKPVIGETSMGRPVSGRELGPNTIVSVGNTKTDLRSAIACGMIVEINGQYVYASNGNSGGKQSSFSEPSAPAQVNEGEQERAQEQEPAKDELTADQEEQAQSFDPKAGEVLQELSGKVADGEIRSLSNEMINTGTLSQEALSLLSQRLGVTPEEASAKAQTVHDAFMKQAHAAVGPASEAIFEYARANAPDALRSAIMGHLNTGSKSGYRAIAQQFMENLDKVPGYLESQDAVANLKGRRERDGTFTIQTPAGRTNWRVAVRSGLLGKLSFNERPW